jgi:hypothetical protein
VRAQRRAQSTTGQAESAYRRAESRKESLGRRDGILDSSNNLRAEDRLQAAESKARREKKGENGQQTSEIRK